MIFIDTSYLAALALPRDALHDRAQRWAESITERTITTDFVIVELVNGLSRIGDREKVNPLLQLVKANRDITVLPASRELVVAGLHLHESRPDKEWSLTDCISFEVMREYGSAGALTHDHHFEQAGFEALLRRDPPA
jgi:predicted nucleic acid-binding protein